MEIASYNQKYPQPFKNKYGVISGWSCTINWQEMKRKNFRQISRRGKTTLCFKHCRCPGWNWQTWSAVRKHESHTTATSEWTEHCCLVFVQILGAKQG